MHKIDVKIFNNNGTLPKYQSKIASGVDLHSSSEDDIIIEGMDKAIIPTGIHVQIPEGYEAQIRPRSGLAAKNNITVINSPGTIDADYIGEIKVILFNLSRGSFTVKKNDRIAQMVFCPVVHANFIEVNEIMDFDETERGDAGFGSTGIESIATDLLKEMKQAQQQ